MSERLEKLFLPESLMRTQLIVNGLVQGVGFRPFVYQLAKKFDLSGNVCNVGGSVVIEVQGDSKSIDCFISELQCNPPRGAKINATTRRQKATIDSESAFSIGTSAEVSQSQKCSIIPPDTATCDCCLRELFDPNDRRYLYPFISCTDCGPRFTVIKSLPYDRVRTSMDAFAMCVNCLREHNDPSNRRFHSQLNACQNCGPSLWFIESNGTNHNHDNAQALALTIDAIDSGMIAAIKGLGGFHLVCDATSSGAISKLRQRKHRKAKPFAVIMENAEMVQRHCRVSDEELAELSSERRPIVLLQRHSGGNLPDEIAPGIESLGVMLPYTPLHHLLLAKLKRPLVMTSGNLKSEPIVCANSEAFSCLKDIADVFLMNDRDIQFRCDDSVVSCGRSNVSTIRRARGIAPVPITLPFKATVEALGVGAHLKNTFCLVKGTEAFLSPHIGDLENLETFNHYANTVASFAESLQIKPEIIAYDAHPDYLSTSYALEAANKHKLSQFEIQHHHAHIVSCMVENGLVDKVIGVAFDGQGYGRDGSLWGGEFLVASLSDFERVAHLQPFPLPGGIQGIKHPWRMALSYVYSDAETGLEPGLETGLDTRPQSPNSNFKHCDFSHFMELLQSRYGLSNLNLVKKQIKQRLNSPLTSSCGRLFDAISAVLDICADADYEGQAAIELESTACRDADAFTLNREESYDLDVNYDCYPRRINAQSLFFEAYADYRAGTPKSLVSVKFHRSIANMIGDICLRISKQNQITDVCLSGGVFQNKLLKSLTCESLTSKGLRVFTNHLVPCNDGGLALGQSIIALAKAGAISSME